VVELLNLWHHDPEDLLLDLGFGKEEADISAKIPARFINSSSVATGINLGVFLDAQKLRMEMESPNLYNRFQQLEALQKANDMFSSLYTDIVNQSLSSGLTTEEQQHLETKEKCRKMLRKLSQDVKDSQSFVANNEKVSGRDRQVAFHRAHQCIPEDSVLAPLTAAQNEAAKKALDMPLNMKEGQVCTSLEMVAKGRDGESQRITFQTKKLKICTSNQPPDSFEMEEVQSFDEDSCPRMATNKIFLDMKRENSCQSDSSGFLEEPFIPLQIQRALQNVSDDSISSQATLQENGQWPSGSSDLEQATDSFTDQTCTAGQLIKTLQQLQQTARIISASPHALQEVETMKKSLYGFRNRLLDLEQEITEQQASVYNVLTKDERDDVKRLRNLRQAVRHEVSEMEVQLEDRTRQLGEGMGMVILI
ncbi:hypothetical protein scyTo_0015825, partial [Scyliorhinus torazame]|nr:hypothetical protein [Scyliorhinus torazame]